MNFKFLKLPNLYSSTTDPPRPDPRHHKAGGHVLTTLSCQRCIDKNLNCLVSPTDPEAPCTLCLLEDQPGCCWELQLQKGRQIFCYGTLAPMEEEWAKGIERRTRLEEEEARTIRGGILATKKCDRCIKNNRPCYVWIRPSGTWRKMCSTCQGDDKSHCTWELELTSPSTPPVMISHNSAPQWKLRHPCNLPCCSQPSRGWLRRHLHAHTGLDSKCHSPLVPTAGDLASRNSALEDESPRHDNHDILERQSDHPHQRETPSGGMDFAAVEDASRPRPLRDNTSHTIASPEQRHGGDGQQSRPKSGDHSTQRQSSAGEDGHLPARQLDKAKKTNSGAKAYACRYAGCTNCFPSSWKLGLHRRSHNIPRNRRSRPCKSIVTQSGQTRYGCVFPGCTNIYSRRDAVRRHLKRGHRPKPPGTTPKRHQCEYVGCTNDFVSRKAMLQHMAKYDHEKIRITYETFMANGKRRFACVVPDCAYHCSAKWYLELRMVTYHGFSFEPSTLFKDVEMIKVEEE